MNIYTVDLYERYGIPRNGANGGYLTSYIRVESAEIKKTRASVGTHNTRRRISDTFGQRSRTDCN